MYKNKLIIKENIKMGIKKIKEKYYNKLYKNY